MFNAHCYVCDSKRRFNYEVNEIRRIKGYIIRKLERFNYNKSNNLDKNELRLMQNINMDSKHIHFMCGSCVEVNKMELDREEKELKYLFIKAIRVLKSEDSDNTKSFKRDLFDILRGHYPKMARIVLDELYLRV